MVTGLLYLLIGNAISYDKPFGYIGPILISILGAFALWRTGAVKAWKETAEAREGRLKEKDDELREMHDHLKAMEQRFSELKAEYDVLPRLESIIRLMNEQYERSDTSAEKRTQTAMERIEAMMALHTAEVLKAYREMAKERR